MNLLLSFSLLAFCVGAAHADNAKTCAACHASAGLCASQNGYVTCNCMSGYVGNGVNCSSIASCTTETCCSKGYYWDNRVGYKVCADINECTDATLNKCVPSSTCTNKNGVYLCGNNRNIACTSSTCPFDQDCLNVGGVVQCADPCSNYQLVNGTNRLSTINSTGVFVTDRYNVGWYRYSGSVGLRMQEGCVGSVKCGSAEPFTLNSSQPAIGQGVVLVPLLSNSVSGCTAGGTIPVKACSGQYYVYKFSGSLKSDVYCTDPTTDFVIPTLPPTTTTTTTTTTTPATTTPATTTPDTTTPATTTPDTTTPATTTPATTTPATTTPATTTPATTTPATTTPATTTPDTTILDTTTPATTTPDTTTPVTTAPTTTSPTTEAPTTEASTTATTTTSVPTTTQPEQIVIVTTLRSSTIVSVTATTETVNGTDVTSLELNETTTVYIEVKTISPTTIRTNINNSVIPFYSRITIDMANPVTFTDKSVPQDTGSETIAPNQQVFQPNLYSSKPAQTRTITETLTINNENVTSTTTTTTTITEEIIVIEPPLITTSAPLLI